MWSAWQRTRKRRFDSPKCVVAGLEQGGASIVPPAPLFFERSQATGKAYGAHSEEA